MSTKPTSSSRRRYRSMNAPMRRRIGETKPHALRCKESNSCSADPDADCSGSPALRVDVLNLLEALVGYRENLDLTRFTCVQTERFTALRGAGKNWESRTRLERDVVRRSPPRIVESAAIHLPVPEHLEEIRGIAETEPDFARRVRHRVPTVLNIFEKDHILSGRVGSWNSGEIDWTAVASGRKRPVARLIGRESGVRRSEFRQDANAARRQVYAAVLVEKRGTEDRMVTPGEVDRLSAFVDY